MERFLIQNLVIMANQLSECAYGKIKIRVMKLNRGPNGVHTPHEMVVNTLLYGDFAEAWTTGSNARIVATETQKNTIYQLAKSHDLEFPWINKVRVELVEEPWGRIEVDGKAHKHAFTKTTTEKRTALVIKPRGQAPTIQGGIENLVVLKTTMSSFEAFVGHPGSAMPKDPSGWTTLGEAKDRMFSTAVESRWTYSSANAPFSQCYFKVKEAFIKAFAGPADTGVPSPSAQITQHQMCLKALDDCAPHLSDIHIKTPNLHYNPLSALVTPEHMHAPNKDVFYPIDGPSGFITSTASRKSKL